VAETTAEQALSMIEVPYLAAFNLTCAFLPKMIARAGGAIACVTSPASYVVWPSAGAYAAARHALAGFTESLRADLKGTGISVTLVVLGVVETPYWEHNPGSREHVPARNPLIMRPLTSDEAPRRSSRRREPKAHRGEARDLSRLVPPQCDRAAARGEPAPPRSA
jgi:short-subunit dehydrogenase